MKDKFQLFQSKEFGELRIIEIKGDPYFPATDCARMLGYKDTINAIKLHCKLEYPWVVKHQVGVTTGTKTDGSLAIQKIRVNYLSESNLYRLILRSKLPAAERFSDWVTEEILPTLRKTGTYQTDPNRWPTFRNFARLLAA